MDFHQYIAISAAKEYMENQFLNCTEGKVWVSKQTNNKQNKMKNWFKRWLGIQNIEENIVSTESSIDSLKDRIYYLEKHFNISLVKYTTEYLNAGNCSSETKYVKRKKSK